MQNLQLNNIEDTRKLLSDRGICVIIPTYNNAGNIVDVVTRAQNQCNDVIVVCDGCTDNTLELLNTMAIKPIILNQKVNRGKGTALKVGFQYALKNNFAYAITIDADGQHFPEDIPTLLKVNVENPGALIVGQRKDLENVERTGGSKFANSFSNFWFAVQTGKYLPDTQTGYRLYPLKKIYGLNLLTSKYEAELELLVFAAWHGVKLVNIPVNVYYPPKEQRVSHFRPIKDFTRITILNCLLCVLALVYGLPLTIGRILLIFLRSLYSICFFTLFSTLIAAPLIHLYLAFGKNIEKKKDNLHRLINWMACFIQFKHGIPGVKLSISNPTNEDFKKPSVIISNHQSHLDLLSVLTLTPKLIVLTADWVWNNPFYKHIIRNAEFLPTSLGMDVIMPHLQSLVNRGYSILVYPEGTRSIDCSIARFHKGAFYIADKLNVDIIPVVLYGAGKALPKHGRYLRKWPIHLEIYKRMNRDEIVQLGDTHLKQASQMRAFYIREYQDLANQIEKDV